MVVARRVVVTGRVQGVGFRDAAAQAAFALGVHGWVRNRRDGTVEALAQGDADAVDRFVEWCRKGPPSRDRAQRRHERGAGRPGPARLRVASDSVLTRSTAKMSFHAAYDAAAIHGNPSTSPTPIVARPASTSANE